LPPQKEKKSEGNQVSASSLRLLPEVVAVFLHRWLRRTTGITVMLCGLALAMALGSYTPEDASWNTAASERGFGNGLGPMGSWFADVFLQTAGAAAFFMPLALLLWGWQMLDNPHPVVRKRRLLALSLALLLTATGLQALYAPAWWHENMAFGGAMGALTLPKVNGLMPDWLLASSGVLSGFFFFLLAVNTTLAQMVATSRLVLAATVPVTNFCRDSLATLQQFLPNIDAGRADLPTKVVPIRREPPLRPGMTSPVVPSSRGTIPPVDEPVVAAYVPVETDAPAAKPAKTMKPKLAPRPPAATDGAPIVFSPPPLSLLATPKGKGFSIDKRTLQGRQDLLTEVLTDFGVKGQIVGAQPGPVVTLYELEPAPGIKSSRVISLADDIARSMSALSARVAVVPGRNVIGIELPNEKRDTVLLKEILVDDGFRDQKVKLPLALGKDIGGLPVTVDLAKMPHLLVAGTTGSGKSVAVNAMILSLLYRLSPAQCRFIMVDPKMLELSIYDGIPHLLTPVVTDPKKAVVAMKWTVKEMENRYQAMSRLGVRNIDGYNQRVRQAAEQGDSLTRRVQTGFDSETGQAIYEEQALPLEPLPYIVVIVDEMADLMLVAGKDIEAAIQRLAQMARAAGIHLIMATQRPSVDVITGTIKANFPTRISFQVTSKIDSRTILGEMGAEQLLGQGDMLYMAGGGRISRVHGPFVADQEVEQIVAYLRAQGEPEYIDDVTVGGEDDSGDISSSGSGDALYDQAVNLVIREGKVSTSFIQRHLQIGYNRAARIVEQMEEQGIISKPNHTGKREILGR
jgi:DNA segregation ATPase FtsK/SpoIIIE, S-DNA-T family